MNFTVFLVVAVLASSLYTAREAIMEFTTGGIGLSGFTGLLLYALVSSFTFGLPPLVLGYLAARARPSLPIGLAIAVLVSAAQVYAYPKLFAINDLTVGGVQKIVNRTAQVSLYVEECTVYAVALLVGWLAAASFTRP